MQTYTVRIGLRAPSAIMLRQLDRAMGQKRFILVSHSAADNNGYREYCHHTSTKSKQQLCALVYSIAERIQQGPVVLIDEQA